MKARTEIIFRWFSIICIAGAFISSLVGTVFTEDLGTKIIGVAVALFSFASAILTLIDIAKLQQLSEKAIYIDEEEESN